MTIPRDVVRPRELSLDALDEMERLANTTATISEPGEFITDANGHPLGIDAPNETQTFIPTAYYSMGEVTRLLAREGLGIEAIPRRWPSLRFIEEPAEGEAMTLDELFRRLADPDGTDENGDLRR